jgi:hypothetical protein
VLERERLATAVGGPAAGRRFAVEIAAGYLPLFLGLAGANYVLDRSALFEEVATCLHRPAGAGEPVRPPALPG